MYHDPFSRGVCSALPILLALSLVSGVVTPSKATEPAKEAKPAGEKIRLWTGPAPIGEGKTEESAKSEIIVYRPAPDKANGAALVICPGGGYSGLALEPEGYGIARWLAKHGVTGIVLNYRLPAGRPYVPLLDAQRAVRIVRSKAEDWKIDPHRVGIVGFSAGGHVASTAATPFDDGNAKSDDPIRAIQLPPGCPPVLIYPVVTMGEKTHGGSKAKLLGDHPTPELIELFSNEKQVTKQTPPMFLAHAKDDPVVVPENSRLLAAALKKQGIAVEYLELPDGGHGLNGYKGSSWDAWQKRSLEWLAEQKFIPAADAVSPRK